MPLIWPTEIPAPNPEGYKLVGVDTVSRSPVGEGYERTRRRAVSAPTLLECQWLVSSQESRALVDFHRYALKRGTDACLMPVWAFGQFHAQTVLFQAPPEVLYHSYDFNVVSAKLSIQDELGTSLWRDIILTDADSTVQLAIAYADFTVSEVDIYVRTPPNSDVSDVLRVGIVGDGEAFVTDVDVTTAGRIHVQAGHANAGAQLGVLQTASHTVTAKWNSTYTTLAPTQCDIVVIVPYAES